MTEPRTLTALLDEARQMERDGRAMSAVAAIERAMVIAIAGEERETNLDESANPLFAAGPFKYEPRSQQIFGIRDKLGGDVLVINIRSWGYLTGKGHGGLALDNVEAARVQDEFGFKVAELLNHLVVVNAAAAAIEEAAALRTRVDALKASLKRAREVLDSAGYRTTDMKNEIKRIDADLAALETDND